MLRKHSIIKYVLLALLAVVGIVLCVVPFNVPASTDKYNSLIGSISKDFDLSGGISAIYRLEGTNNAENIDKNINKLRKIINYDGIGNYSLYRQGENRIRFDIVGATEFDTIFSNLENGKELSVTLDKVDEENTAPKVYIGSEDVEYAYGSYDSTGSTIGLNIEFASNANIKAMKKEAETLSSETAYIYLGDIQEDNLLAEVSLDEFETSIFVTVASSSSYSGSSYSDYRTLAYNITAGVFCKELTLEQCSAISPILGGNTMLYLGIASLIIVVLSFAFLWVRYGDLGLISILSLVFFLIFDIFLLQAIPGIVVNVSGFFGILFGYIIAVIAHVMLMEKIRKEYAIGKKIHIACKGGFKGSLWQILDTHFMLAIAGFIIWIVAPANLKVFAITMLIGLLVSACMIEGMMRLLINTYLPINPSNAKRMHLYREANVVEIKEEEDAPILVEGGQNNE